MKDAKYLGMVAIALIAVMGLVVTGCGDKDGGDDQAGTGGDGGKKCCGSAGGEKCCSKTTTKPATKPVGGGTVDKGNGGKTPAPGPQVESRRRAPGATTRSAWSPWRGKTTKRPNSIFVAR